MPLAIPVAALVVIVVWAADDGGYPVTLWYPGGLFLAALLAIQLTVGPGRLGRDSMTAAVAMLAAFGVFQLASIAWASARGAAWDSGNRTLVYAFVLTIFVASPLSDRGRGALALLLVAALTVVAATTLFSAASDPGSAFVFGRLMSPTGYANASAALFLIPFWPAVALAADPTRAAVTRGAFLGCAATLLAVAIVPQSRAAVYAFPLVAILLLLATPFRIRTALALVIACSPTAILIHTLTRPFSVDSLIARGEACRHAADAAVAVGVVVGALGVLLALLDRKIDLRPPSWYRYVRLGALAVVLILVIGLASAFDPRHEIHRAWASFRAPTAAGGVGGTRLLGNLGSNRYDFWRVSLDIAKDHPILGVGADNFSEAYLVRRRSGEQPQYPHSLEMSLVSQTGAVGTTLFAAFLLAAGVAVLRVRRVRSQAALAAGCATGCAYWFVHGSVDWLWEFPALAGPALAFLGLAISVPNAANRSARRIGLGAAVLAAVLGVMFVPPWLAAHQTDRASTTWQNDPELAYSLLRQAGRLDPLSDQPAVTEMTIAAQLNDDRRVAASARDAIARDPNNWYSHLQLAVALEHRGRWRDAEAELDKARRLNPREMLVDTIAASVRARHVLPLDVINREVLERVQLLDPRTRADEKVLTNQKAS